MKRLNVKKLAALGIGAALIGTALAPIATAQIGLQKSDLISSTGQPIVDVVAGSNAAVSDIIWAGNIATRVAQLANVEVPVTYTTAWATSPGEGSATAEPTNLSVDLTVGGETTYAEGVSKTYDDQFLNSPDTNKEYPNTTLTDARLSFLVNKTVNYKYNGTNYEQLIKETVSVDPDIKFETNPNVKDLVLYMKEFDFMYEVSFSKGLPLYESEGSATAFTDNTNDNVLVYLFGSPYTLFKVENVTAGDLTLKFVKETGKLTYTSGQEITGLKGKGAYAGRTMTIKFVDAVESSTGSQFKALLELYDDEGNLVDTETVEPNTFLESALTSEGNEILETSVYLETVDRQVGTNLGYIIARKGADVITLKNNQEYPYDATATGTSNEFWKVMMETGTPSTPNVLSVQKIKIYNNIRRWDLPDPNSDPLYAGDDALHTGKVNEAKFLEKAPESTPGYNFVKVVFDGFKNDQSLTTIRLGNKQLEFYDTDDFKHVWPFAIDLTLYSSPTTTGSFTVDNQTFYYRSNITDVNYQGILADGNFEISRVDFSSASSTDYITPDIPNLAVPDAFFYRDKKVSVADDVNGAVVALTGAGMNDRTVNYAYGADEANSRLSLFLYAGGGQVFSGRYNKDIIFYGTDTGEDGIIDLNYYRPDDTYWGDNSPDNYYVAWFGVDEDNAGAGLLEYNVMASLQTDIGDILSLPNTNLSTYGYSVGYLNPNLGPSPLFYTMTTESKETQINKAYTDYGTLLDITDGQTLLVTAPENQLKAKFSVVGGTAATGTSGYQCTGVAVGSACTTDKGLTVTVDKVNYTPGTCTGGAAGVSLDDVVVTVTPDTALQVVAVGNLVKTDQEVVLGAGKHIIVGGHKVNALAQGLTEGRLTAPGDEIVDVTTAGDYLVAGYTAADTERAAKEFIAELEALVG